MSILQHSTLSIRGLLVLGIALLVTVAGCVRTSSQDDNDSTPADVPDPASVERAASSSSEFGFDMFNGLAERTPDENVITSPYSATVLLMLLLNGAGGETREAIGNVLHLDDPFDENINLQHQALEQYLTAADTDVELAIANSLWANEGIPLEEAYMNDMREYFDAEVAEVDLGSQEAADQIDQWVSDQTNDLIDEMAEDLQLPNPNAVLVLLNAVYYSGNWTEPFDPEQTADGMFTLPDGSEVEVPMMHRDDTHLWAQQDGFKILRLPYGEEERFGMEVFLPNEDRNLTDLRSELDQETWSESLQALNEGRVDVRLPSFELEFSTEDELNNVLKDLGMAIAYGGDSDFTPMSASDPWLDTIVQKTFIRVDETGTEAAAVTGGVMEESMPPQFHADRPFIFTISDIESGTILFLGQVTDPSQ